MLLPVRACNMRSFFKLLICILIVWYLMLVILPFLSSLVKVFVSVQFPNNKWDSINGVDVC
jgi:hypothetical protein